MTNQAAQASSALSWLHNQLVSKKTTLNSVQLKAASEQKQHVQNKDFNLKNPTNSLWVTDVQRSNPKAMCLFTHTEDRITENLSLWQHHSTKKGFWQIKLKFTSLTFLPVVHEAFEVLK